MSNNINFFNSAMKLLRVENAQSGDIGTTAHEFAENYANASGEQKGTSIWTKYYETGKQQYDVINSDGRDGITQKEFSKIEYYLDRINKKAKAGGYDFSSNFECKNDLVSQAGFKIDYKEQDLSEGVDITQSEQNPFKNMPERRALKNIETMTSEEIISEIYSYDNNYQLQEDANIKSLKKILQSLRAQQIEYDENSDVVDQRIGTFMQGNHETCALLSKANGLSSEDLKKIYVETPENSGNYTVTFPIDSGNDSKSVTVTKEELENGEIYITGPDGEEYKIGEFSKGDKDIMLLEMAFMKRFGANISVLGADIKLIEEIFTFPEDRKEDALTNDLITAESYLVTEDKLIDSLDSGNHPIVTTRHISRRSAEFSYKDDIEITNSDEITTAKWGFATKSAMFAAKFNLKRLLGKDSPMYSKIDNMSDAEFMDFADKFVGSDFSFNGSLIFSNGVSILEDHAYSIVSYDAETKTAILSNPHNNNEDIAVPLEVLERFFDISV